MTNLFNFFQNLQLNKIKNSKKMTKIENESKSVLNTK